MSFAPYWPNIADDSGAVIIHQIDIQPYSSVQIFPTRTNTVGYLPAFGQVISKTRYIDLYNASSSEEAPIASGFFSLPAL